MQGIYRIHNKNNGKCYVGSSKNIPKRWAKYHRATLLQNKHYNAHLQNAWNKHGEGAFVLECLEVVSLEEDLLKREQYWIDFYQAANRRFGYNIAPKADRSEWSEETRRKVSERLKGKPLPLPPGYRHSEATRQKIGAAGKRKIGVKLSDEHIRNIGIANRNRNEGKTYEEIYGEQLANQLKEKKRKSLVERVGPARATEIIERISRPYETKFGKEKASQITEKQRKARIGKCFISEDGLENIRLSKIGCKNPNYKIISADIREAIIFDFIANNYKISTKMVKKYGVTRYKLKQVINETNSGPN